MAPAAAPQGNKDSTAQGTSQSDGQTPTATAQFYQSWMTGWSLQSCRNLYFELKDYSHMDPDAREKLLSWLGASVDLVERWKLVDSSAEDDLKKMLEDVEKGKTSQSIAIDAFDKDVAVIHGTVRSQVPYGYYAASFASDSSRLPHPRSTDIRAETLKRLHKWLLQLRHTLPPGAYDVIKHDIKRLKENESPMGGLIFDDMQKQESQSTEVVQVWSDLMLGTMTATDALTREGRVLLYVSVGAVGIVLFSFVGLVITAVFLAVPYLTGTGGAGLTLSTIKDLLTSISTLVTTLSAAGLSLALLATKAWNLVKGFEPWAAVQLARWPRVRKRFDIE